MRISSADTTGRHQKQPTTKIVISQNPLYISLLSQERLFNTCFSKLRLSTGATLNVKQYKFHFDWVTSSIKWQINDENSCVSSYRLTY